MADPTTHRMAWSNTISALFSHQLFNENSPKLKARLAGIYTVLGVLGFDTATEVAMFGMSVEQAAKGVSFYAVLVFPALFAAGMSLIDTTDGVMMLGARLDLEQVGATQGVPVQSHTAHLLPR